MDAPSATVPVMAVAAAAGGAPGVAATGAWASRAASTQESMGTLPPARCMERNDWEGDGSLVQPARVRQRRQPVPAGAGSPERAASVAIEVEQIEQVSDGGHVARHVG